jgi:type IV pilus assembly protein PilM
MLDLHFSICILHFAFCNFLHSTGAQPLPFSRRLGWIGVDVGTHTVKLAQAARDGAGVRLHRAAVIQRPATWNGEDALALEQPGTSRWEIRAALECGGFSGRDAICTLPMNVCQLRGLNVPPGSDQERRAMASDELTEEWSEKKISMEFDFWEMDPGRTEKSSDAFNVSILAASRPWIAQLWRDCRQSGLDCWGVDGVPLAMARAVGLMGGLAGGQRALAVDWGYSNTTLCVVGDGRPLYSRRIHDCAFGKVLVAIMDVFGVSLDEAQHLLDTQGVTPPDSDPSADHETQAAITDAAADTINELIHQLRRTLQFMETQRRHLQPAAVWLLGGGASTRNIASYLEEALKIPVHIWEVSPESTSISCAAGQRAAVFGNAVALSALAWGAA